MTYEAGAHVFVDESKSRDYIVVATAIAPLDLVDVAKELRSLVLPGQRRVHFSKESDRRRRAILAVMTSLPVTSHVYVTTSAKRSRDLLLEVLVADLLEARATSLVIERDESLVAVDQAVIHRSMTTANQGPHLRWMHDSPTTEPRLWISDAVAWSYARGGDWRRRVQPILAAVVTDL
ncbi:MAG: hypothetical protein NVV57_01435 [Demequina sp.]|jgi:hypothetical protein|nr:hypothetical protein [Demequina sp.]